MATSLRGGLRRAPFQVHNSQDRWGILGFVILDAPQWLDAVVDLAERPSTRPYFEELSRFLLSVSSMTDGVLVTWSFRLVGLAVLGLVAHATISDRRARARQLGSRKGSREPILENDAERRSPAVDGRIVVDVTPEYLTGLFKQHLNVQAKKLIEAYIGKWMKVSGPLGDVYFNQVTFGQRRPFERATVYMYPSAGFM